MKREGELITIAQAEKAFGVPGRTLRGAIARKEIPARLMGNTYVVERSAVARWKANRPKPGPKPPKNR